MRKKLAKRVRSQRQGQGYALALLGYPCRIWGLAAIISVTLNLVVSVFIGRHHHQQHPISISNNFCDAQHSTSAFTPAAAAMVEAFVAAEQHDQEEVKMVATKTIDVSATSGVRPGSKDAIINLDHGDPTMYEEFWKRSGDRGNIMIPGWKTMSYFSDVSNLCWFMEPEFANQVKRLHNLVGNAVVDNRYIIVGTGSTQLFQAALFALSPSDAPQPMSVVSEAPWYSSYPAVTDFLQSNLFRWAGDARKFKGERYIELVCTPNNPDGSLRKAVLSSNLGKTIHDLAYYWPQYTPITDAADHDIMLFTVSKCTGHAGTRLGWALVKDYNEAKKMMKFIELSTIGVSKDSQVRAAQILKVISDSYQSPDSDEPNKIFAYGRTMMANRWKKLREAVKASGLFTVPEFPSNTCKFTGETVPTYPAFAWLKCDNEEVEDCEVFLKSHKILTRSGRHSGVSPKHVRISMLDCDETFNIFIERLTSLH